MSLFLDYKIIEEQKQFFHLKGENKLKDQTSEMDRRYEELKLNYYLAVKDLNEHYRGELEGRGKV